MKGVDDILYHRELNYIINLIKYYITASWSTSTYFYFIDTLYRYLESIDIFVTTTPIEGGDDMLHHRELNYIDLPDLGRGAASPRADLLRPTFYLTDRYSNGTTSFQSDPYLSINRKR